MKEQVCKWCGKQISPFYVGSEASWKTAEDNNVICDSEATFHEPAAREAGNDPPQRNHAGHAPDSDGKCTICGLEAADQVFRLCGQPEPHPVSAEPEKQDKRPEMPPDPWLQRYTVKPLAIELEILKEIADGTAHLGTTTENAGYMAREIIALRSENARLERESGEELVRIEEQLAEFLAPDCYKVGHDFICHDSQPYDGCLCDGDERANKHICKYCGVERRELRERDAALANAARLEGKYES